MTDVTMAPAADMFEMGVKLQVLKRGTMFAGRSQKLYELYRSYNLIGAIPREEKEKIEKQIFRRPLEEVWDDTKAFFKERDMDLLHSAQLLNYFGKTERVDKIINYPILLRKGESKLALYGLGNIRDERLHRYFQTNHRAVWRI